MATPLDIGILAKFNIIFPFLLILIGAYVFLSKTTWFKEKQAIAFVIAFVLALMTLLSPIAVRTINMMAPWFILLLIFMLFVLMAYQTLGVPEATITEIITNSKYSKDIFWWVMVAVLIIGIGSLASVVSHRETTTYTGSTTPGEEVAPTEETGFWQIASNPKILGVALILIIAMFTIQHLAKMELPGK
jgi:hypothetical protein